MQSSILCRITSEMLDYLFVLVVVHQSPTSEQFNMTRRGSETERINKKKRSRWSKLDKIFWIWSGCSNWKHCYNIWHFKNAYIPLCFFSLSSAEKMTDVTFFWTWAVASHDTCRLINGKVTWYWLFNLHLSSENLQFKWTPLSICTNPEIKI